MVAYLTGAVFVVLGMTGPASAFVWAGAAVIVLRVLGDVLISWMALRGVEGRARRRQIVRALVWGRLISWPAQRLLLGR